MWTLSPMRSGQRAKGVVSSMRSQRWLWLACGIALAGPAGVAHAQINPFRDYKGPVLSQQDLSLGLESVRKLLEEDKGEVGRTEPWSNPATGNRGEATVLGTFRQRGMSCRSVGLKVEYSKPVPPRSFKLRYCQLASGQWKLL